MRTKERGNDEDTIATQRGRQTTMLIPTFIGTQGTRVGFILIYAPLSSSLSLSSLERYGGIFHDTFSHHGHRTLRIQGSDDGLVWKDYRSHYNLEGNAGGGGTIGTTGPLDAAGAAGAALGSFFAPHFPRLQHQFFYEANEIPFYTQAPANPLYHPSNNWFLQLQLSLLEGRHGDGSANGGGPGGGSGNLGGGGGGGGDDGGSSGSKDTSPITHHHHPLDLFRLNPFEKKPPGMVRALVCRYRFNSPDMAWSTGEIWGEPACNVHLAPVSLCLRPEELNLSVDDTSFASVNGETEPRRRCHRMNCQALCAYVI